MLRRSGVARRGEHELRARKRYSRSEHRDGLKELERQVADAKTIMGGAQDLSLPVRAVARRIHHVPLSQAAKHSCNLVALSVKPLD